MCLSSRSRDGEVTLDRVGGPQAQSHVCTLGSQGELCHTEGERPGDRGGGDPGNVTTSQGMSVSTRSCRRRGRLSRGIQREHGPTSRGSTGQASGGSTAQTAGGSTAQHREGEQARHPEGARPRQPEGAWPRHLEGICPNTWREHSPGIWKEHSPTTLCVPSTDPNLELPASRAEECVLLTTSQVWSFVMQPQDTHRARTVGSGQ